MGRGSPLVSGQAAPSADAQNTPDAPTSPVSMPMPPMPWALSFLWAVHTRAASMHWPEIADSLLLSAFLVLASTIAPSLGFLTPHPGLNQFQLQSCRTLHFVRGQIRDQFSSQSSSQGLDSTETFKPRSCPPPERYRTCRESQLLAQESQKQQPR